MTRDVFISALKNNGISPDRVVSFEDYDRDDIHLVRQYEGKWELFYWEHGQIHNRRIFSTESKLLEVLLSELIDGVQKYPWDYK